MRLWVWNRLCCLKFEKRIQHIHIFGDTKIVFNLFNKTYRCYMHTTIPILHEINLLKNSFNGNFFCHIYREWNRDSNGLSNDGDSQDVGTWNIKECNNEQENGYYHWLFVEGFQEKQWIYFILFFQLSTC